MKKDIAFISIKTEDRLPSESGYYHTKIGLYYFDKIDQLWYSTNEKRYFVPNIKIWLEPQLVYTFSEGELEMALREAYRAGLSYFQTHDINDYTHALKIEEEFINNILE